jgi:surface antigen
MRIAVLTGVFACAVIFAVGSDRAGATTLQTNEATDSNDTIVKMVAVSDTNKSSLLRLVDADLTAVETDPVEPVAEVIEPTKHVVEKGDSLVKIAEKHNVQWKRIYDKNTTIENPDMINVGEELIIPKEDEVLEERVIVVAEPEPVVSAPAPRPSSVSGSRAVKPQVKAQTTTSRGDSSGNRYTAGYCTWYVKNRRPDLPNNLGNASTWVSRAAAQGMATGSTPRVGAVGQQGNHVVYIESVNGDGTVTVSDMNWSGLYVITTRTVPASNFSYIY